MTRISCLDFQAKNIQFLEFELSNQCQFTKAHTWCPRSKLGNTPVKVLSTDVIDKVLKFFKAYSFSGTVYFSIYNEPLLDNRIFDLISKVKAELGCTVQMYTNGILADLPNVVKLFVSGLDILRVSIYSRQQQQEVEAIHRQLPCNILPAMRLECSPKNDQGWDDRIGIYDRNLGCKSPCYMPMQYYLVNCSGEVMLCWDDWKSTVTFGNLYVDSVEDTLIHQVRLSAIEALKRGERIGVCAGCDRPTWMCLQEYRSRLVLE